MFLALILLFSIGSIHASDVNATDVDALNSNEDIGLQLDENAQAEEITGDSLISSDEPSLGENIKNQTQLTSPTTTIYYNGNYQVTLIDSNTNATIPGKEVAFSINKVNYFATTDSNGIASVNLKLNPGKYQVSAYFSGDDTYSASNKLSGKVKILTTIKSSDVTKYYKGAKNYQATFLDSQGNPLKNTYVKITINGKKYVKATNKKGVVSIPMDFEPGVYKIVATNPSTGYKLTTTFKILSTVESFNLKKVKGDGNKFIAKFLKSNGKPLANKYVKVNINGKDYSFKTNSKGKLKLSFNSFKKGTYKVFSYNRDGLYKKSTVKIFNIASTKLTVGFYTFLQKDNKKIKIKFSTNLGDYSKSGKKIEIIIGGQAYYKKTDSDGVIKFKLPSLKSGVYEVECTYYGDKFFVPVHVSNYVTILDTSDAKLKIKTDPLLFGDFAGTPLKASLTAGKVPLIKKAVRFIISGKNYNVLTDLNGIASLPINLDVGKYTVQYKTFGDDKVNGCSGSFKMTVFKRTKSQFDCQVKTFYKDYSQTFRVLLTGVDGKRLANEVVELTIDGETYAEVTNSRGYAVFQTFVPIGKYKVSVKFGGNNGYLPGSSSFKINVELSKFSSGINEKNAEASDVYLESTKNCQVNNERIKALVNKLTKGLTDPIDKAKALYNYVRDNIVYDYYYDTHKGAVGTLLDKSGNCVDQAHLLNAMYRTAGFKARYVHGTCDFSDGQYGHVWTQVLVDHTWVCGDPINRGNSLGKITNWNTNTYHLKSFYLSLPF